MGDNYNSIIIRYSEIAVKGRGTRRRMENLLIENLRASLSREGVKARLTYLPGRIILTGVSSVDRALSASRLVFGVKSVSPAIMIKFKNIDDILNYGTLLFKNKVRGKIFRVRARRVGEHNFTSKDVERLLGERLYPYSRGVNLTNPEYTVYVEIRGNTAFFYDEIVAGPGGLPVGSEEPVLVLFSGGFDSTLAAWLVARRGSRIGLAYYDLGVQEAWEIALEVASEFARLWARGWTLNLYKVDFNSIKKVLIESVRPEYRLLLMRRLMIEHASGLALAEKYEALATGDNIGQVASQTVRNIRLVGSNPPLPIIRPVAGFDKDEIMEKVYEIGLYDIVNRQVEPCANAPKPVPRGSLRVYREELTRLKARVDEIGEIKVNVEKISFGG